MRKRVFTAEASPVCVNRGPLRPPSARAEPCGTGRRCGSGATEPATPVWPREDAAERPEHEGCQCRMSPVSPTAESTLPSRSVNPSGVILLRGAAKAGGLHVDPNIRSGGLADHQPRSRPRRSNVLHRHVDVGLALGRAVPLTAIAVPGARKEDIAAPKLATPWWPRKSTATESKIAPGVPPVSRWHAVRVVRTRLHPVHRAGADPNGQP